MSRATVLAADTLLNALVDEHDVTVPAVQLGEVLAYPVPRVRRGAQGEAAELVLDLRAWRLSLPGHLPVPVECLSAQAATEAATQLRADAERGAVTYTPAGLTRWATSWCATHPDAAMTTSFGGHR